MSRRESPLTTCITGFPRVSGDEPLDFGKYSDEYVFSPRERG